MRELAASGYLSNRPRQVAASYLFATNSTTTGDGAAWFEAQLVDCDVYSNQGNWLLYIAGRELTRAAAGALTRTSKPLNTMRMGLIGAYGARLEAH